MAAVENKAEHGWRRIAYEIISDSNTPAVMTLALLIAACLPPRVGAAMTKTPTPLLASEQTVLTPDQMEEDLDYVVRMLENVHPATHRGFSEQQIATIDAAYQYAQEPMTTTRFYFLANTVICSLQDAHTQLRPMKGLLNRRIDVPISSLSDGFYVECDREPFRRGDRIVALGDKDIETIVREMRSLIPAENEHWRRLGMAKKLQRHEFLNHLGVVESNAVDVGVERNATAITLTAPLKLPARVPRPAARPWVGHQVFPDLSLGLFYLDKCTVNDSYRKALRSFFERVRDHDIRNVAIDVRQNGGGNSRVIDEFLRYLDISRYRHFGGDIRYSKEVAAQRGYSRTSGYRRGKPHRARNRRIEDKSLLFDGKLFVLTSPATFSSGNWFAVIIRDNDLGTVIGEPTGNAPSSYGDIATFQMPNTGFSFTVSHKRWARPNPDNDPENALYPDIPVFTTIDDIINGTDPQIEKLQAVKSIRFSPQAYTTYLNNAVARIGLDGYESFYGALKTGKEETVEHHIELQPSSE